MIRDTLLHGPVRQALETPAEEHEPEVERRVAAPRGSGPHGN